MSTHEKQLRERLNRLQELDTALLNRITAEQSRLWRKYMELQSLRQRLVAMAPLAPFVGLGALIAGGTREAERALLLDRMRYLEQEIQREQRLIEQLQEQRSVLAAEIQRLAEEISRVRLEEMMRIAREEEARRQREIAWLLEELNRLIRMGDVRGAEEVKRRLRALGYNI